VPVDLATGLPGVAELRIKPRGDRVALVSSSPNVILFSPLTCARRSGCGASVIVNFVEKVHG